MEFVHDKIAEIVSNFQSANSRQLGWTQYCELESWIERDKVTNALQKGEETAFEAFLELYKLRMAPFIRDDFYDALENNVAEYAEKYARMGEMNIPFLKIECLDAITEWALSIEHKGNSRYNSERSVYPPGEVKQWDSSDPRKVLKSEVNMVAVGSSSMGCDSAVQWIYHSPHLQLFVQKVMQFAAIFPYHSDLGVAVNIMRPSVSAAIRAPKTALGFHFDTIDSSVVTSDVLEGKTETMENKNSRGATGVIGIRDCTPGAGGERISFPQVNRQRVNAVAAVVENFNPLFPSQSLVGFVDPNLEEGWDKAIVPRVVTEPIAGLLSLFNGGDILHAVSSVRDGIRVATVFLYCETPPVECQSVLDSSQAFYSAV